MSPIQCHVTGGAGRPTLDARVLLCMAPIWLAMAATVASCGGDAEPLADDTSGPDLTNGRLLFVSDRDGADEIYSIDLDGGGVGRLTDHPAHDVEPAWAPDRPRVAFRSDRDGDWEIYLMDPDGANIDRLTHDLGRDIAPAWSPAGSRIAFASERNGSPDIYVLDLATRAISRITSHVSTDEAPSWSPDGLHIAFTSERDGSPSIYRMDADGGDVRPADGRPSRQHTARLVPGRRTHRVHVDAGRQRGHIRDGGGR